MDIKKVAAVLFILAVVVAFLILGREQLIPLVIAIFIWYLINTLSHTVRELKPVKKYLPSWASTALTGFVILAILLFISILIIDNATMMVESVPKYQKNLQGLVVRAENALSFSFVVEIKNRLPQSSASGASDWLANINLRAIVVSLVGAVTSIAGNFAVIIVYLIFVFIEQATFGKKMKHMLGTEEKYDKLFRTLESINEAMRAYFGVKIFVSGITAVLAFGVMTFAGLDFAFFWAFLIFLLNFIPNVGSLIATVFPAALSLVQFDNFQPFLIVVIGIGIIQFAIGNYLEPRLLGSSLNISSLAVLLSLVLWGTIWGVTGMFLCVPITVGIMIIFAQFPSTRQIAILLSSDGDLMDDLDEIYDSNDKIESDNKEHEDQ